MKFIMGELFSPFFYLYQLGRAIAILLGEIIMPIFSILGMLFRFIGQTIKFIFYLPTISLSSLFFLLKDGFMVVVDLFKSCFHTLAILKNQIVPAAKTTVRTVKANKETTFNVIQLATQIALSWSQSLTNKVIKGFKAVYDFTVYVSCEISKHKTSLYRTSRDYIRV